jgi:GTP pyrophosphokinase
MHRTAEYGIGGRTGANKEGTQDSPPDSFDVKLTWLRQLLEWQKDKRECRRIHGIAEKRSGRR